MAEPLLNTLNRLNASLDNRLPQIALFEDYYGGNHRLAFATTRYREAFGALFAPFADNWCQLVVEAAVQRLEVEGFNLSTGSDAGKRAWQLWQSNAMDAESVRLHTAAITCGSAYAIVDPYRTTDDGFPLVTVEHPGQVIVERDSAYRRRISSAFKRWIGNDGFVYGTLYLPDEVIKFRSEGEVKFPSVKKEIKWTQLESVPNPLGVVPVVPFENKASMLDSGVSDLEPVIPIQDAVNKLTTDLLIASEFSSYRQRVLTGVEMPVDPETGLPVKSAELKAAMNSLWSFEDPNVRVTELGATDLNTYMGPIRGLIEHIAAVSATPANYLSGQISNISADALRAAELNLVYRVNRKQLEFGHSWEQVIRLCFKAMGETDNATAQIEAQWKSAENQNLAQMADALNKLATINVPYEELWRRSGATPQEIEQWRAAKGLPVPAAPTDTSAGSDPNPLSA